MFKRLPLVGLAAAGVTLALALVAAAPLPLAYQTLTPRFEPLKSQFNADAGRVRLLLLLSPT